MSLKIINAIKQNPKFFGFLTTEVIKDMIKKGCLTNLDESAFILFSDKKDYLKIEIFFSCKKGQGKILLDEFVKTSQKPIVLLCPQQLESNNFYLKYGFEKKGEKVPSQKIQFDVFCRPFMSEKKTLNVWVLDKHDSKINFNYSNSKTVILNKQLEELCEKMNEKYKNEGYDIHFLKKHRWYKLFLQEKIQLVNEETFLQIKQLVNKNKLKESKGNPHKLGSKAYFILEKLKNNCSIENILTELNKKYPGKENQNKSTLRTYLTDYKTIKYGLK